MRTAWVWDDLGSASGRACPIDGQSTSSLAAYDYYLRGRSLLSNRSGTDPGRMVAEARGMFEKSLAADTDYAPAVEGLAEAYNIIWLEHSDYRATTDEHRNPRNVAASP
jgi:hypothetical protein